MDVKVDIDLIKQLRQKRAMSQEQLAAAAGLSLRTVQRIESEGIASMESKKAMAGVFGIDSADLDDKRQETAEAAAALRKEVRLGTGGAIAGGLLACAAITYSWIAGAASAATVGAEYALIAAATGIACMLIGLAAKRRQRAPASGRDGASG